MSNLTRSTAISPLDELFRGFFVRPVEFGSGIDQPVSRHIKVDVRAQDNAYILHAELPGFRKEDIQVDIDGSVVSISAERTQEKSVKEGERLLHAERFFGKVSRSFDLGAEIDDAAAVAKYTDGVLELTLPRKLATPNKRLHIQ